MYMLNIRSSNCEDYLDKNDDAIYFDNDEFEL